MRAVSKVAMFAAFLTSTAGLIHLTRSNTLGFSGEQYDWSLLFWISFLLLLGIVFGCLYRQIAQQEGKVNIIAEVRAMLEGRSFWTALLVSPFAFGVVYVAMRQRPDDPAAYLFAFQNGFFCESVFQTYFAKKPGGVVPQPPVEGTEGNDGGAASLSERRG